VNQLSAEQQSIVGYSVEDLCVVACAGSGKTMTAVHRLASMRRSLGAHRGRIVLVSFSNVAVDTFRSQYRQLVIEADGASFHDRVEVSTLDALLTSKVLRPHGHRTMKSKVAPFLVTGSEPFLNAFMIPTDQYPRCVTTLEVGMRSQAPYFFFSFHTHTTEPDQAYSATIVNRLGKTGAYTYDLARYWCYRVFAEQPHLLRAFARRYPHIVVDEAQDVLPMHAAILGQLQEAGVKLTLIGDPCQAIYEFAGADGAFLKSKSGSGSVHSLPLTKNYRSVPSILTVANAIASRSDNAHRAEDPELHAAYFVGYQAAEKHKLIDAFEAAIGGGRQQKSASAVVCRGNDTVDELTGAAAPAGQGTLKGFAKAALLRDGHAKYVAAFEAVAESIVALLKSPPEGLLSQIKQPTSTDDSTAMRRKIWSFTRDPERGLPSASLLADAEWHPRLLTRIKLLLVALATDHGLSPVDNVGRKLAKTGLTNAPLIHAHYLAMQRAERVRIATVHQVKGQSLNAVLYIATKAQIEAILGGVGTELGRIGYVAVTRARDLFWLGVPGNALSKLKPALLNLGLRELGAT